MRPGKIKYKTTVELDVTANELLEKTGGDLFSVTPETAIEVARDKLAKKKGRFEFTHVVKGNEGETSVVYEDKDTEKEV